MLAHYGFKDGSGEWYIIIDTDKCNGCGNCVESCTQRVLEIGEDEYDPFRDEPVAKVTETERKKLRYTCAPCKPIYGQKPPPCVVSCKPGAISHSLGWKLLYGKG